MKLSTKSRYGVRMLLDMAIHEDSSHVNLADIAQRQDVSLRYLEQIAAELKRSGIIKSVRGAHGGYRLNMLPNKIILSDILTILEGDLLVVDEEETFSALERCMQQDVYAPLNDKIASYLSGISLQDMADQARHRDEGIMYFL